MTHRFCSDNAVLTRDGVSRLFSGECTKDGAVAEKAVLVNGEAYVRVEKDNLMNYPKKVVVDVAVKSDEDAVKAMAKYCGSEEAATFAVTLLKVGVVGGGEGVEEWCGVCSILMLSINGVFVATKRGIVFPNRNRLFVCAQHSEVLAIRTRFQHLDRRAHHFIDFLDHFPSHRIHDSALPSQRNNSQILQRVHCDAIVALL